MIKRIDDSPDVLQISAEKVCFVILKARERSAKDVTSATNSGANALASLLGEPLLADVFLADVLEEGLDEIGRSCTDDEAGRL